MIALITGQAKEPLFDNGVLLVPEGHPQTDVLVAVSDSG
jgi:hypothetical protein